MSSRAEGKRQERLQAGVNPPRTACNSANTVRGYFNSEGLFARATAYTIDSLGHLGNSRAARHCL